VDIRILLVFFSAAYPQPYATGDQHDGYCSWLTLFRFDEFWLLWWANVPV